MDTRGHEHTDMIIEDSYAQNVYGSPAFVENYQEQEEDDKRLDKLLAEGLEGGKVCLGLDIMLEATEQGLSRGAVASLTGQSLVAISRACKKYASLGVYLEKEKTGPKTDTAENVKVLLEQGGLTIKEIGDKLGISRQRVYKIKKQLEK